MEQMLLSRLEKSKLSTFRTRIFNSYVWVLVDYGTATDSNEHCVTARGIHLRPPG